MKKNTPGDEQDEKIAFLCLGVILLITGCGRELTPFTLTTQIIDPEDEFVPVELRSGGKNVGYLYIAIAEGAVPA